MPAGVPYIVMLVDMTINMAANDPAVEPIALDWGAVEAYQWSGEPLEAQATGSGTQFTV